MEIHFDPARVDESLTSFYRELVFLTPATTPRTLVSALTEHLPHLPGEGWTALLLRGGAYVNGVCVKQDQQLPCPCRIQFYEPKGVDDSAIRELGRRIKDFIVYEDDELLVVYKPQGISSMPTREQQDLNLKCFLESYLQSSSPGAVLHMPSRVDTSVEGLVVTSKALRMHAPLQRVFERRAISKTYLLETKARVEWDKLTADRGIAKDPRHPILRQAVPSGGKPARTEFRVLARISDEEGLAERTILKAQPITGRTHQIRVHASSYGIPITGDNFYNGARADRLHLVSYQAEFVHPHQHVPLKIVPPKSLLPDWLASSSALFS